MFCSGDTLTSIAARLASAINANTNLQNIGVSATSASTVVNISSTSNNNTTHTQSTSGGATETITLGYSANVVQSQYNNINELTGRSSGGATRFQGTTNKAVQSVTLNSTIPATLNWSESFSGNASLSAGTNAATVKAVDGAGSSLTNTYNVLVNGTTSQTLTYDANGNLTSDGTNSYSWDAENRLIKITYPGTSNNSQFTYDGLGRCVEIVETVSGTVTSTKQFVWCGSQMCEARNASGTLTNQYFPQGETISGSNYYFTTDHLGSVRELTNSSGAIQAQYSYDSYGQPTQLQGSLSSDFQYAGYYFHSPSGLCLTLNRAYNASLGRWLNRDPIAENGGVNLYGYVGNNPISWIDPSGLDSCNKPGSPNNPLKGGISAGPDDGDPDGDGDGDDGGGGGFGGGGSGGGNTGPGSGVRNGHPYNLRGTTGGFGHPRPPVAPPGVSLNQNIKDAQNHFLNPFWFVKQVTDFGPWDYKSRYGQQYADFGNFNYGATGHALGIPLSVLLNEAGIKQVEDKNSDPSFGQPGPWWNPYAGTGTFGDDPVDQTFIRLGYFYGKL